jgi:hypothetical protein
MISRKPMGKSQGVISEVNMKIIHSLAELQKGKD